jgi:hypothetical protein
LQLGMLRLSQVNRPSQIPSPTQIAVALDRPLAARNGHPSSAPIAVFHLKGDDRSNLCATTSPRTDRLRRRRSAVDRLGPNLDPGRVHRGSSRERFSTRAAV